jgi:hypothetical protein
MEPIIKMFTAALCVSHARRQFQHKKTVYCHSNHYIGLEKPLGLVHMFLFSTRQLAPIIARQSSGTQESTGVFTRPGHLAGRLPGGTWSYPLLCPVAGW